MQRRLRAALELGPPKCFLADVRAREAQMLGQDSWRRGQSRIVKELQLCEFVPKKALSYIKRIAMMRQTFSMVQITNM